MSCCNASNTDRAINSALPCPTCKQPGQSVNTITPRHTLHAQFRDELIPTGEYFFCENPECGTVYFHSSSEQHFATEQLINRVTCKDPSPDTPLCYCFKISKGDAISEYQRSGESSVLKQIEQKMSEKPCFCDRSNPRGLCCMAEIESWLKSQRIKSKK